MIDPHPRLQSLPSKTQSKLLALTELADRTVGILVAACRASTSEVCMHHGLILRYLLSNVCTLFYLYDMCAISMQV